MAEDKDATEQGIPEENIKFEDVIEEIGCNGRFQIRMNIIFNCIAFMFTTMSSYAKILALTVPEHWCHVPGLENTSLTVEMWKNLTIPRENDKFSSCLMKNPEQENETMPCMYGWDYDTTWFSATAVSQENWVCDKGMYPNTLYSVSYFVSVPVGVFLFYIGDRFGRKLQFLLGASATAISQTLLPASASVFPLYTVLSSVSLGAHLPTIEATLTTGVELASIKQRSSVNCLVCLSYCFGAIAMALVAWLLKNWTVFILVASVPCFVPLLLHRYLPESPRWLISKGYKEEAYKVLERIASTNGKTLPPDVKKNIDLLCKQRPANIGIKSIVTNKMLLKNTILLVLSRSTAGLIIFSLLFINKSFGSNPFVAYIGQGSLQIVPSYAAHEIGNRFGRRITHCLVMLAAAVTCVTLVFTTAASSAQWIITTLSLLLMFWADCSMSFTYIQSLEVHPTSLRQMAVAIEYVFAHCIMSASPYLALLELHIVFGVLAAVTLVMSLLMSFLPESYREKLPETKKDISLFGKEQKYWSLPVRK